MALRAGLIAGFVTLLGGALLWGVAHSLGDAPDPGWGLAALVACTGLASLGTAATVHANVARRLREVIGFLKRRQREGDVLRRLPEMGRDEVGEVARLTNELFASMTSLKVDMIDQRMELAATQEELRLKEELAARTEELQQRLRERALLFDILRISVEESELQAVLARATERMGRALSLREMCVLLREGGGEDERFVIRSAFGFEQPDALLGRSIAKGEGIAGEVAEMRQPIVLSDVSVEPGYLAFWGEAQREGAFAAFPVFGRSGLVGLLAMTRAPGSPFSEVEIGLIAAMADQLALAIRQGELMSELKELSTHDELTGLANRRLLRDRLEREVARAHRFMHPLSVLVVDIDHFKDLNDRCGHQTGDQALREVAALMSAGVRRVDTVARVGGEEFVILLPSSRGAEAARVAEDLRLTIASAPIPGGEGQPEGGLTVSIGVAELLVGDDEPDALLARADEALYRAKSEGRNRVVRHAGPASLRAARS